MLYKNHLLRFEFILFPSLRFTFVFEDESRVEIFKIFSFPKLMHHSIFWKFKTIKLNARFF